MNDELRVTVVATGIGMDKRPEITLVTSKQAPQPVIDQRYQQHGLSPLPQESKPAAAKVVNDQTAQGVIKNLTIWIFRPSCVSKQTNLLRYLASPLFVLNCPAAPSIKLLC